MLKGPKRSATLMLLAAGVILGGCDNSQNQADKKVRAALAEARMLKQKGDESAFDSYRRKLDEAANVGDASQGVRAQAKAALAEAHLEATRAGILKISRVQSDLNRVLWEIAQLTEQIRTSGNAVAGYQRFDPKPAREAIDAKIVEAQGGAGKVAWFTHESAVIPTLFAANQQITTLEADLAQHNDRLNSLTQQRTRAMDDADKAYAQSDQLKGEQALAAFKQAADLRKQAGDLAVQIDKVKAEAALLTRNIGIAKGQQSAVNEVITQLQGQSVALDKAWKDVDTQRAAHRKLSAEILGTTSGGDQSTTAVGGTISQKAVVAERLSQELDKLREEAVLNASNAAQTFAKAYDTAEAAKRDLTTQIRDPKNTGRAEVAVWESMVKVLDPLQFRLQSASAQRLLGDLQLDSATDLANRISVRDSLGNVLGGTGLALPPSLSGGQWVQQRTAAMQAADEAFKDSDKILVDLIEGTGDNNLRAAAHIGRALTQYSWAQAARLAGNTGLAKTRIDTSRTERNLAAEMNVLIPIMPSELGTVPKPAGATPESPTTEPATSPAAATANEQAILAVVNSFADALEKGDADAGKALAQIESGQEEFYTQLFVLVPQFDKFRRAVSTKFGNQGQAAMVPIPDMLARLRQSKVRIDGDAAFLEAPGAAPDPNPTKDLARVDGKWKMYFGAPATPADQRGRTMIVRLASVLPGLTANIEAGKYATFGDFARALAQEMGAGSRGPAPTAPQ